MSTIEDPDEIERRTAKHKLERVKNELTEWNYKKNRNIDHPITPWETRGRKVKIQYRFPL